MPEAPDFAAGDQIPVPWPDGWVWTGLAGPDGNTPSRFTYDEWVQDLRDNAEARRAKADSGRPDDLDELRRRLEELRNTPCADGETPAHHTTTTGVIMTKPDSQTLREIAWEIVLDHAQDIEYMSVGEIMADNEIFEGLDEDEFNEIQKAVHDQARAYAEALTKPDGVVRNDEDGEG